MVKLVFRLSLEKEKLHMAGMYPMVIYKVSDCFVCVVAVVSENLGGGMYRQKRQ